MLSTLWFYLQTRFVKDEEGQGMVEYGLILALVAIAVIGLLRAMGVSVGAILGNISTELDTAIGG
ncbi:MAG: Flp family type IVb pilin [Firmicutes bacterium]|mgnify:CR=1 FL=1|jgi:pilus assembly protein Flp/PilA|nr:Flp family type IVb pilin [Bacillota bacterium]